jgi:hypothetical protein
MKTRLFILGAALVVCLAVSGTAFAGSLNLLNHLSYVPAERNQGSCGDCWVWASTGVMEIARSVQSAGDDRLSIQFLNSCKTDRYACFGGTADMFRTWYQDVAGFAIPWSNTNASFQDATQSTGQQQSNVSCDSIAKSPNYPVGSTIGLTQLTTTGNGQTAPAIAAIKSILNQNRAVWMGFFLPSEAAWHGTSGFATWFSNNGQSAIWNPDSYCGSTWQDGAGGHAVIIVGYNDDDADPSKHYWIVLNSWGTANGIRPDGLYHLSMNVNYGCTYHTDAGQTVPGLIFFDFDYDFPGSTTCTYSISPTSQSFGSGSGSGGVNVTTQSGCQWTVSGNPNWVTISGASSGTGSGTVSYSVAANGGAQSRQSTFTIAGKSFTVTQEGSSTLPTGILKNGDFESGIKDWTEYSSGDFEIITNYYPWAHAGSWFAWLAGYDLANEYIYQELTIPANATSASVNFFYQISTEETESAKYDTMEVDIVDPSTTNILKTLGTLDNRDASDNWGASNSYDISEYKGQTIGLAFWAYTDDNLPTSFLVDDVNLTVSYPPKPNLTPYQPNGWSDNIVVANTTGSHTDINPLYTTDNLYVDWAVMNNGSVATSTGFSVALYLDSVLKKTWSVTDPLPVNNYAYINDYSLGSLSAGTHTLRIVADSAQTVTESSENDNEYMKTITVVQPVPRLLSMSISGNGSVKSNPSGIDCTTGNSGTCSHQFGGGSTVTLMPTPSSGSMLNNWGGICSSLSGDDCLVQMSADKSVTATFTAPTVVRIPGIGGYGSLQSAYNTAPTNSTIQAQAVELPAPSFTFNPGKIIVLEGGYDSGYSVNSGYTTMNGILTLGTGSLTLEKLIIK